MREVIGLLGATGYTGRLVAAELADRGIRHRLGGRSPDRLAQLTGSENAEIQVVDAGDPAGLRGFLDGLDAVISCVGPFATLGRPVVDAAVAARVPYVDSTGEPDFMAEVYDAHAGATTPVVPACGFDYLPADLAAALAAEQLGAPPEEVRIGYQLAGVRPSRGTIRSALGVAQTTTAQPRQLQVRTADGCKDAVEISWGDRLAIHRHLPGAQVRTGLVVAPVAARILDALAPAVAATAPLFARAAPLAARFTDRLPEGPPESVRRRARFTVSAEARAGDASAVVHVEGRDIYRQTARFLVEAALRVDGAGAMAPAQALRPREFLDAVRADDLHWRAE